MEQIIKNIALLDTLNFCKSHNIDPSGTHIHKYPRRFTYALVRISDGKALVTVTYYKNQAPLYMYNQ